VNQFKPEAEQVILENILKEEANEGILVLEDFTKTLERGSKISQHEIQKEAEVLAAKEASGTLGALRVIPRAIRDINWLELFLSLGTIVIIYGFKRITTTIPSTLVALVIMSGISIVFNLDYVTIQKIPNGIPSIRWEIFSNFSFGAITPYIFTALTLSLLGAIDSLLTSIVADNMTKTKHRPNRELVGQGIGNSVAALFGGIPGAGATIRTVVNINAGGKTKLSGMIAGVMLLLIMLLMAPIASKIPAAVLAGILITVGIGVMDYKGLKAIPYLPKDIQLKKLTIKFSSEVLIMLTVLLLSTFWDLIYAVGIGLVIASLMFMKKIGDITTKRSFVKPAKEMAWSDETRFPKNLKEEVFIKHINGPLFFGNTSDFQQLYLQIPETATTVILRLEQMPYIDQSGLYAIEDMLQDLKVKQIEVLFVGLQDQPKYMMERIDIIPDFIPIAHVFETFDACVSWVKENVKDEF
jgi:SulP family sulfate permease